VCLVSEDQIGKTGSRWRGQRFVALSCLVGSACLAITLTRPPAPVPADAPPTVFSADRALRYLARFATVPHPMGSAAHADVRDFLVSQLRNLGVEPVVQRAIGTTPRFAAAGVVENVMARLEGTGATSEAFGLVAHYDSTAGGPGAADDGAGVAAILETLRAIQAGPRPRNDIIVLFTDGEESGLLGASAFVAEHPWARDLRVVLNFEARGNSGVSYLFETSDQNGPLIEAVASAVPETVGSSLAYELYRFLPNDSDLTVFKQHGVAGLNVAFVDGWESYHTRLDSPALLSRASLQHHGAYALALARWFGSHELTDVRGPQQIFFSVPGGPFIHYATGLASWLAVLAFIIVALVVALIWRRQHLSTWRVALALVAVPLGWVLIGVTGWGLARLVGWLHLGWLPEGDVVRSDWYLLATVGVAGAEWLALRHLLARWLGRPTLGVATVLWWLIACGVSTVRLPGASFVFVWPVLAGALSVGLLWGMRSAPSRSAVCLTGVACCAVLIGFILAPVGQQIGVLLGMTPVGSAAVAILVGMALGLADPQLDLALAYRPLVSMAGAVAVSAMCLATGLVTVRYGYARPKPSVLVYALDADTQHARWASSAVRLDPWVCQFVTATPSRGLLAEFSIGGQRTPLFQHDADVVAIEPPLAVKLDEHDSNGGRTVVLRVRSERHAPILHISVPDTDVVDAVVNGVPIGDPRQSRVSVSGRWALQFTGAPDEGIVLALRVRGSAPIRLVVQDRSNALPNLPGVRSSARPISMTGTDVTVVRRTFTF
jgi:hypothetical protein